MHTIARQIGSRRRRRGMVGFVLWGLGVLGFAVVSQIGLEPAQQLTRARPTPRTASQAPGRFSELEHRAATVEPGPQEALDAYAKLPLNFIANAGQVDPRVRYYAQGSGYGFYLTREEIVLTFVESSPGDSSGGAVALRDAVPSRAEPAPSNDPVRRGIALGLRFVGANPEVAIEGQERTPGAVNYLIGNDPAKWHTGIATCGQVLYRDLWPGIDLALRGETGQLKYEFRVRAGAHVEDIRLGYRGAESLSVDGEGMLLIDTPLGQLRDSPPASYQVIAGRRVAVESRYVLTGGDDGTGYGFTVGAGYNPARPLVIDPGLVYSTFLGGSQVEQSFAIAVDQAGNVYLTGQTTSADFPTTPGAFDRTLNSFDAFVAKLNADGSALVYSTFLGGGDIDGALAVAVDEVGNAYLTGSTFSRDFPTTPGAFDRFNGHLDAFVTKLTADGSALVYSTFLGEKGDDRGVALAVDAAGNAYVIGLPDPDFPTTPGAFDRTFNEADTFVTKLNAAGSALAYSTFLGPANNNGVAVDAAGNAYVTGLAGPDFPTTPGAFDTTFNGNEDAFITKLNAEGSGLVYSTFIGGTGPDGAADLALDAAGHPYVTGFTESADFPTTPGAFDTTFNRTTDAFITKLNATGSALVYSTFLGPARGGGVAVDEAGNAYVTGSTTSADFPTTAGALDSTFNGFFDGFITKLNRGGSSLDYSSFLGGTVFDEGRGVAVDEAGNAYVTGLTTSPDFPTTAGALDRTLNSLDAFVTKLNLAPLALCDGRPLTLVGTDANDVLIGTDGADVIAGLGGNDGIRGLGGDDLICGGLGADVIEGGGGRDVVFGQSGDDLLDGGPSADQLIGDNGDDTLLGGSGPDELYGGMGDDEMNGGTGSDFCVGGPDDAADTAVDCEAVHGVP